MEYSISHPEPERYQPEFEFIDQDEPPREEPKPQCGMCQHYQQPRTFKNGAKAWGHCKIRAQADVHPCNLPPWDSYAEQCTYYIEDCPF